MSRRQLTQERFYALCEAAKARKEQLQRDRPNFAAVARQLEQSLGFPLTPDQVQRAAALTDSLWEPAQMMNGANASAAMRDKVQETAYRATELERRANEDHKQILSLCSRVAAVETELVGMDTDCKKIAALCDRVEALESTVRNLQAELGLSAVAVGGNGQQKARAS